jgi:hypothetical protein
MWKLTPHYGILNLLTWDFIYFWLEELNFIKALWFLMHSNLGYNLLVWETSFVNLIGMNHILDLHVVILNMIPWYSLISVMIGFVRSFLND